VAAILELDEHLSKNFKVGRGRAAGGPAGGLSVLCCRCVTTRQSMCHTAWGPLPAAVVGCNRLAPRTTYIAGQQILPARTDLSM
jgi:hypothetical protein